VVEVVRARDRVAAVNKDAQRAVGRIIYYPGAGSSYGRQRYSNGDRDVKVSTSYELIISV